MYHTFSTLFITLTAVTSLVLAGSVAIFPKDGPQPDFDPSVCGDGTIYTKVQCIVPIEHVNVTRPHVNLGLGPVLTPAQRDANAKKRSTKAVCSPRTVCGSGTKCGWGQQGFSIIPQCLPIDSEARVTVISGNAPTMQKVSAAHPLD